MFGVKSLTPNTFQQCGRQFLKKTIGNEFVGNDIVGNLLKLWEIIYCTSKILHINHFHTQLISYAQLTYVHVRGPVMEFARPVLKKKSSDLL
jgi:hypothetical protein